MIPTWQRRVDPTAWLTSPELQIAMQAEIDDLRAALATARADERERCAKVAESTVCGTIHNVTVWGAPAAQAIRALKDAP